MAAEGGCTICCLPPLPSLAALGTAILVFYTDQFYLSRRARRIRTIPESPPSITASIYKHPSPLHLKLS
ncbi:hypothetical protein PENSPDRAFT_687092 [Peniophora sp. CONT]|nr:hypothetical protein PENSPDRAFT_687092 [Peniophora sp. CONT]